MNPVVRIMENILTLVELVKESPDLQEIIWNDPAPERNPVLQERIRENAFLVGHDFLRVIQKTIAIMADGRYDKVKARRRVEEHLRKYASDEVIIGLAVFFGVSINKKRR